MSINISCPLNNTGYGISSINIVKALSKIDKNISLFPIGQSYIDTQNDYDLFYSLVEKAISDFDINAPYLKIWHQFDLFNRGGKGKYFAFPFFELDTFNKLERNHLSVPDTVLVSSKWAKDVIENNGITNNIEVVPLGVDVSVFDYKLFDNDDNLEKKEDKYIFLNIGKWEVRKGHDILLEIFNTAFPDEQDVELWILASEVTNSYSSKEELEKWKKMYDSPRIKIIPGVQKHSDIAKIIYMSDCGIYPSRAEGWNLEALETMAMNKPVIITDYSAHTEFCNNDNSYLIEILDKEVAFDGKAFKGQGLWAKLEDKQINQTIEYMRHVYKSKVKTNPNGVETAKKFSWNNTAETIVRCITK